MALSLRALLLGAWVVTALGQQCNCNQCKNIPDDDWTSPCFDNCTITGDPHVEHSWRKGYEDGFDFQPQGIWRLATTETCGGTVEVQAFFCQYFFTRLSSAIAYAITINGGDKYIVKRIGDEYVIGTPNVQPTTLKILQGDSTDPAAGVIIVSEDSCVRIKINSQPLYGGERNLALTPNAYFNNIVIKVWGCDTTEEGICGAEKLSTQFIDPESDANLFTTDAKPELWKELCDFCVEDGAALTPPGCPAPPGAPITQPGCEFLRPFGSPRDTECIPDDSSTDPAVMANNQRIRELANNGENCVAFVNLNTPKFPRRTCRDWCQDRGARCVAVRDDPFSGRFPTEASICNLTLASDPVNFQDGEPKTCETRLRDTHCVCEKPDNNAPGETAEATCRDAVDLAGFNFSFLDAADICRQEAVFLELVTYPQNTENPTFLQRLLVYCVQDVCATDPEDRLEVARSYGDRDPSFPPNVPNLCNGPLLCNLICTAGLVTPYDACMDVCSGHRSMLIHAIGRYCKGGLCHSLLEETEIMGLLQHRKSENRSSMLEISDSRRSSVSTRSRRSWSSRSRRSISSRRSFHSSRSRSRRSFSSRSRRSFSSRRSTSSRSRRSISSRSRRSTSSRRVIRPTTMTTTRAHPTTTRRHPGDDDDGSRRRIVKSDDDGSRRRIVKSDDDGSRRRIVKGDDDDGGRRRIVKGDDDGSRRRIVKDDDIYDDRDDDRDDDKKCVDQDAMCFKICRGFKLERAELHWCLHRCHSKFQSKLKPGFDHYSEVCGKYCGKPPMTTTTTTTTVPPPPETCPFFTTTMTTTRMTTTRAHPTTTRRHPGDDDDGSRRRIFKDDDGSRRRIIKGDDDGSRRRIIKGDDDGSRRRIVKGDDDGSRRRIVMGDDDGSRRRIVMGDDDGSRRRIVMGDDDGSRRRIFKGDDDGSRRRMGGDDDDGGRRRRMGGDDD